MARKVIVDSARPVEGELLPGRATPALPACRLPLDTLERVRKECARVYRAARAGEIPSHEASKLIWMARQIGDLLVLGRLENRIAELEQLVEQHQQSEQFSRNEANEDDSDED